MKCPICKTEVTPSHFACHSGAKGGSANTEAQNAARAANAKKGGWPKGRSRKRLTYNESLYAQRVGRAERPKPE